MTNKFLTIKQAAKEYGVSTKTIRRWEEQGKIESMRTPGGHRRFALKDVREETGQGYYTKTTLVIAIFITATVSLLIGGLATRYIIDQKNQNLSTQLDTFLNNSLEVSDPQTLLDRIDTNNSLETSEIDPNPIQQTPQSVSDSGVSLINSQKTSQFIESKTTTEESIISIEPAQDSFPSYSIVKLPQIGFIITIQTLVESDTYFNWKVLN